MEKIAISNLIHWSALLLACVLFLHPSLPVTETGKLAWRRPFMPCNLSQRQDPKATPEIRTFKVLQNLEGLL